jgi:hypothetical protein
VPTDALAELRWEFADAQERLNDQLGLVYTELLVRAQRGRRRGHLHIDARLARLADDSSNAVSRAASVPTWIMSWSRPRS